MGKNRKIYCCFRTLLAVAEFFSLFGGGEWGKEQDHVLFSNGWLTHSGYVSAFSGVITLKVPSIRHGHTHERGVARRGWPLINIACTMRVLMFYPPCRQGLEVRFL